jgi:heterodisulfide reductase subunit B
LSAYAYFPGCSLHGTARDYGQSTEQVCERLGLELRELQDWNCCGSSPAHMVSPWLALGLVGRNLRLVGQTGLDTVVLPCAACYARFRETQQALADKAQAARIAYVAGGEVPAGLKIEPLLGVIGRAEYMERLAAWRKRSLAGLKLAPYYGCLLTRPADVAQFDDPEDPQSLDRLLAALGAEVVAWPGKTSCCGASLPLSRPELVWQMSGQLLAWAAEAGADAIVTACPMCHSNLDTRQGQIRRAGLGDHHLPIYYFTELVGYTLGLDLAQLGVTRHLTEASALLGRIPAVAQAG